ncbi:MAG: hypothetical protein AB1597_05465 [Chloroflexota bacterium]
MNEQRSQRLGPGSKVAVVGGGPAGSLFALYFKRFARERGISPLVTIYEPKRFSEGGPRACNRSAGILSASFLSGLREVSVELPDTVIQSRISGYRLHSPFGVVPLANPEPEDVPAVVFRGGGPLHGQGEHVESFDGYLLGLARQSGSEVVPKRVEEVRIRPLPAVVVDGVTVEYDLVVLACGINSASPVISGSAYGEPETCLMVQDELHAGRDVVQSRMAETVHIFFLPGSPLVFGSLVPKGAFINVSLLASGCEPPSVDEFLENEMVKRVLDFPYLRCCGCRGRAGVKPALNPVDDGFVAIGDASVSRLYKDGIGSALRTARQAAHTAVFAGISREVFRRHYLPLCRAIDRDNHFGNVMFRFHQWVKDSPYFLKAQARLITAEQASRNTYRPYSHVIWGMFTGSYEYRRIMSMALAPDSLVKLAAAMIRAKVGAKE